MSEEASVLPCSLQGHLPTHTPLSPSTVVYFMTGFAYTAANFFFFWWALISMEMAMNAFFRYTAYALPSMPTAFAVSSAGTGVLLMFGGFVITLKVRVFYPSFDSLGLFYLSPFSR